MIDKEIIEALQPLGIVVTSVRVTSDSRDHPRFYEVIIEALKERE